jgi:hypothetical protein
MTVGEAQPFFRQPVDVRRPQTRCAVAGRISVAQIVCKYEDDVRLSRLSDCAL